MAFLEDIFKGNPLTAVAVGLGALLLAPAAGQVLRPAVKAVIKGGMLAYRGMAEVGEAMSDIVADAKFELMAEEHTVKVEPPTTPPTSRPKRQTLRP